MRHDIRPRAWISVKASLQVSAVAEVPAAYLASRRICLLPWDAARGPALGARPLPTSAVGLRSGLISHVSSADPPTAVCADLQGLSLPPAAARFHAGTRASTSAPGGPTSIPAPGLVGADSPAGPADSSGDQPDAKPRTPQEIKDALPEICRASTSSRRPTTCGNACAMALPCPTSTARSWRSARTGTPAARHMLKLMTWAQPPLPLPHRG